METGSIGNKRRSIRLRGYDYSQPGAYFVTICSHNREPIFGEIIDGSMLMNDCGRSVESEWLASQEIRKEIELDAFVVMPNHFHAIVFILLGPDLDIPVGASGNSPMQATCRSPLPDSAIFRSPPPARGPKPRSLGSLIAGFKAAASKRVNHLRNTPGAPVWLRNYYEHIIREEESLNTIREYIEHNPLRWSLDRENPCRKGEDPFEKWLESFRILRAQIQNPKLKD